jgi:hypothetical protein
MLRYMYTVSLFYLSVKCVVSSMLISQVIPFLINARSSPQLIDTHIMYCKTLMCFYIIVSYINSCSIMILDHQVKHCVRYMPNFLK